MTKIGDTLAPTVLRITVSRVGAAPEIAELDLQEVAIGGRNTEARHNDLLLPHSLVSSAHARVVTTAEGLILIDEGSRNGTFVEGTQVTHPFQLEPAHVVEIGPFKLNFELVPPVPSVEDLSTADPMAEGPPPIEFPGAPMEETSTAGAGVVDTNPVVSKSPATLDAVLEQVFRVLKGEFAQDFVGLVGDHQPTVQARAEELLAQFPDVNSGLRRQWAKWLTRETCALGPLTDLLADATVSEILVHGPSRIEAQRHGLRESAPVRFSCVDAVRLVVERLTNTRLHASHPVVDAVTSDGVSVHAVDRSLAVDGPLVVLTRPADAAETLAELVRRGALSEDARRYLQKCVQGGLNIVLSSVGGASSLPLVAALMSELPATQRLVVVHRGEVWKRDRAIILNGFEDMTRSVRIAQRFHPDWLVALNLVGAEAAELCAAARRTHGGTVCTLRASTATASLDRLQGMVAAGGGHPDVQACRNYVAGCFDVFVCVRRAANRVDLVTSVCEVRLTRGVELVELFSRAHDGGALVATGVGSVHE